MGCVSLCYHQATLADAPELLALMRAMQDDDPWSVPFDDAHVLHDLEALIATPHFYRRHGFEDHDRYLMSKSLHPLIG
jgi:hypothetical protein